MMLGGALLTVAAVVLWLLPDAPIAPRVPLTVLGPLLRRHRLALVEVPRAGRKTQPSHGGGPVRLRRRRHDVDGPRPALRSRPRGRAGSGGREPGRRGVERGRPAARRQPARRRAQPRRKAKKTRAEQVADIKAEREKKLKELATRKADEIKVMTTGSYLDTVEWRARRFLEKAATDAGFGVLLVSMFLLGAWFVRSGVMEDTARHLALFRKLALYGLPLGIGTRRAHRLHRPVAHAGRPPRRLGNRARPRHARQPAGVPRLCRPGRDDAAQPHGLVAHPRPRAARAAWRSPTTCSSRSSAWWSSTASGSAVGDAAGRSRCCSWRPCSPPRSRSATGGWRAFATARWSGSGAASPTGRCRRCASARPPGRLKADQGSALRYVASVSMSAGVSGCAAAVMLPSMSKRVPALKPISCVRR